MKSFEDHQLTVKAASSAYVTAMNHWRTTIIEAWHAGVPVEMIAGAALITPEHVGRIVGEGR